MSSNMREDWIEVELDWIVSKLGDGLHGTPKYSDNGEFYFINGNNLSNGKIEIKENTKRVSKEEFDKYKKPLNHNTILVSINGTIGNLAFYNNENVILGKSACYFNLIELIDKKYIYLLLSSTNFLNYAFKTATGSTIKNVPLKAMREYTIPLAPLPIQRAIVSKIEALFSDLDNGIANFKKAQAQLKIYRQAVLKKAFEGKFTNEWRAKKFPETVATVGTGHALSLPQQQPNPQSPTNDNLPKGWKWVKISDVCDMKAGYFIKSDEINSEFENGLFPCYGGNGLRGYVKSTTHEGLFPIVGRQGALCGNVHLVNGKFHATEHAVVVTAKKDIDIKYLYHKLTEMKLNQYSTGTAQPGLSVNKILPIEIIYPSSLQEQTQIVQEIESRLSVCDKMEQSINESIEKAEALRQSILKKAFEGKLLSQAEIEQCKKAADYEPAAELLKKIKLEKLAKNGIMQKRNTSSL
jgi:type I restriction enzyme, S subunit